MWTSALLTYIATTNAATSKRHFTSSPVSRSSCSGSTLLCPHLPMTYMTCTSKQQPHLRCNRSVNFSRTLFNPSPMGFTLS
ncbi:hypothetical protein B0T09DRAFT_350298 [Sordaria sp. MPI-SDFR-AT-0083]|nr:hypothetical protein B0T09DRAFT_350298 [Sordaria sp. MPI-SDFR-AT-0083]